MKILKHGKEGLILYKVNCSCGCEFICERKDLTHQLIRIAMEESIGVWHTNCPECRKYLTIENLEEYKDGIHINDDTI